MYDLYVILQYLPCKVKEFTKKNSVEDCYTIVLNSRISSEEQNCAYLHEMQHITKNDFSKEDSVDAIEFEAHEK